MTGPPSATATQLNDETVIEDWIRVGTAVKVAVIVFEASIVTVQSEVPVHGVDHPVNVDPVAAVALRVTLVPPAKLDEHVLPHKIPEGTELTVPLPVPDLLTVNVYVLAFGANCA